MAYIKIGQIVNTHGNKGELKVYPLTDDIKRYYDLRHVYINQDGDIREYYVLGARTHKGMVILDLKEITDMNQAEKLKGCYLELPESELMTLPEGHYYIFQIIGLDVYENDCFLGKIKEIFPTGSNDVYVVTGGKKTIYLPATKEVIKDINLESGIIQVSIPAGLLD